jgi:hypothetical protein
MRMPDVLEAVLNGIELFIILVMLLAVQAAWRGGAPERLASAAMLVATVATMLANTGRALPFREIEWRLLWIDAALLAALVVIAMFADRFWPMWVAALQALAVSAHAARGVDPHILPFAYWLVLGKLSYPMILMLCIAIERHQWRKRRGFPELAWSDWHLQDSPDREDGKEDGAIAIRFRVGGERQRGRHQSDSPP